MTVSTRGQRPDRPGLEDAIVAMYRPDHVDCSSGGVSLALLVTMYVAIWPRVRNQPSVQDP
jgi:hypothetical protein